LLADFPKLLLGFVSRVLEPEYKVKVTLESRDQGYSSRLWRTSSGGCRPEPS